MARIEFAARILRDLNVSSVLDVGCREGDLADELPGVAYAGADLFPDKRGRVTFPGDINTVAIPGRYDAVVALDILEHLESPSKVFDRLAALSERYLLVSFPNTYDLKSRMKFVTKGQLGGKYVFREEEPLDRHRWLMNRDEVIAFYKAKAEKHGLILSVIDMTYGATGRGLTSRFGKIASAALPKALTAETVCGLFERLPPAAIAA